VKIIITGFHGQLAGFLVNRLSYKHRIFALSHNEFDISDKNTVSKIITDISPDLIINCAAYNDVDKSEYFYEKAFNTNAIGPENLAKYCGKIKLIHFGTDYVFDGKKRIKYTENDLCSPLNKYGITKYSGEKSVIDSGGMVLRVSWLFGGERSFVSTVIKNMKKEKLYISDDQISVPTYSGFVSEITEFFINNGIFEGLYNVVPDGEAGRYEYASYILRHFEYKGEVIKVDGNFFEPQAKRPEYSGLDNSKLKKIYTGKIYDWKYYLGKYLKTVSDN